MIERRSSVQAQQDAGKIRLTIPYESWSEDLGGFRERILPTAFGRSIGGADDVLAFWSHDPSKPLARRSNGTLTLSSDRTALTAVIEPDAASWSEDAVHSVASGTVSGASFAFEAVEDRWYRQSGEWRRDLVDVTLIEVSPVVAPAYPASTATAG